MESNIVIYIAVLVAGGAAGYFARIFSSENQVKKAEEEASRIIETSKKDATNRVKEIDLELKENKYKMKVDFERETKNKKSELLNFENRVKQQQQETKKDLENIKRKEDELKNSREKTNQLETKYGKLIDEELQKLEKISGMTQENAKEELKFKLTDDAKNETAFQIKKIEDEAKKTADTKAMNLISLAIQRCATDHITETTVSVVELPSDDMKGRIIGREGRNIRALETATGIDLIIDDTPGAVILSGYDPIRREVARVALENLIHDGRIHPTRIEEIVEKSKKHIATKMREEGEKAAFDTNIAGLHPDEIKLLGRLKYRTSYSQNVLQHSKEVAYLAGIMAAELGGDVQLAKRAGLLHDIGKAVDHQTDGTHAQIGVDLARRYNEHKSVINAIASHHEDVEANCIEAVLVAAADALSAARPGARREMLETYIKRLTELEKIGKNFKGVDKAYAIQAGREIRVIVKPEEISDSESLVLSKDIAKKIEKEMAYPGEIKVTVIRETRNVDYAR